MKRVLFIDAADPVKKQFLDRFYPLWPCYLAAYVEKYLGPGKFEFRILNDGIEKELASYKPDLVAISSVSYNYNFAKEYARIAKSFGLPVIIGGIHISYLPQCLTKDMDVGCIGEGEETFLELMRYYLEHGDFNPHGLGEIKGIVYYCKDELVKTPDRPFLRPLDMVPHPKRSLKGYQHTDTILTARGCPYRCVFCSTSRFWDKVRYASPEYVMEEIQELIENGTKIIKIYDDLFTFNKKRLKQIVDAIILNGFHRRVSFTCWCRADTVDPELVETIKSMNIVSVEMGLESGCERTMKYLKGNGIIAKNWRAIELLKDAGIQANASFIIGVPDETEEEILQTYNFINKSRLDTVTVNTLTPFPGTPVWDYATKRNLVSDDMDWDSLSGIILSEKLSQEKVKLMKNKLAALAFRKRLKALPRSPWLKELPRIGTRRLIGKIMGIVQTWRTKYSKV